MHFIFILKITFFLPRVVKVAKFKIDVLIRKLSIYNVNNPTLSITSNTHGQVSNWSLDSLQIGAVDREVWSAESHRRHVTTSEIRRRWVCMQNRSGLSCYYYTSRSPRSRRLFYRYLFLARGSCCPRAAKVRTVGPMTACRCGGSARMEAVDLARFASSPCFYKIYMYIIWIRNWNAALLGEKMSYFSSICVYFYAR